LERRVASISSDASAETVSQFTPYVVADEKEGD